MSTGILDQLAAQELLIPGIVGSYADPPNKTFMDAELPCFINLLSGTSGIRQVASDMFEETNEYTALLLVQQAASGIRGEASAAIRPWADTVRDFFIARPTLDSYRRIKDEWGYGFQGHKEPGRILWPGAVYLGVEFTFRFIEIIVKASAE